MAVNFNGSAGMSFHDRIRQPQAYKKPDTLASTGLNGEENQTSTAKKVAIGVGTATLAAAALGAGHKYGLFQKGESEILNTIKSPLNKAGKKVLEATNYVVTKAKAAKDWVKSKFSSEQPKPPEAKPEAKPEPQVNTGDGANPVSDAIENAGANT